MLTLAKFKSKFFGQIVDAYQGSVKLAKDAHYDRNYSQPEKQTYLDMLLKGYDLADDASSAFHRIGLGNENNSKFVRGDGNEYVFSYRGGSPSGQFYMVTDERNMGTYNFDVNPGWHMFFDVAPWVRWGNSKYDATTWTQKQRFDLLVDSGSAKLGSIVDGKQNWTPSKNKIGLLGDDLLKGTLEEEAFRGGFGTDTADYSDSTSAVVASLQVGKGFEGFAKFDTYQSIENLTGSKAGDILVGNRKDNVLIGGDGRDIIVGLRGDDVIYGGYGYNELYGNGGNDTFYLYDGQTVVKGGSGKDTLITNMRSLFITKEQFKGIETYQLMEASSEIYLVEDLTGSNRAEELIGNSSDNWLRGNGGADVLDGGKGKDSLDGGKGNDDYIMQLEWGTSIISEEGGFDRLIFRDFKLSDLRLVRDIGVNNGHLEIHSKTSDDIVFIWNQFANNKKLSLEKLVTADRELNLKGGLPLIGTDGHDSIMGTEFGDEIDLKGGVDHVRALGGEDRIIGGTGNDILWGGEDNDTYIFRPGFGRDQIIEEGAYLWEKDSNRDIIELQGIARSSVDITTDFQGRMTINVLGNGGVVTDSIFIQSQVYNSGDGLLVEYIRFDGGALIPLTSFVDIA